MKYRIKRNSRVYIGGLPLMVSISATTILNAMNFNIISLLSRFLVRPHQNQVASQTQILPTPDMVLLLLGQLPCVYHTPIHNTLGLLVF